MHMVVAHIKVWTGGCMHGMYLIGMYAWSIRISDSDVGEHALHMLAPGHHM